MNLNPVEIRALVHIATKCTGTPIHDEDLEQDIALHALEALQRLPKVTHPRALLMKIVRDAVRDYWRRRRSSEDLEGLEERFIAQMPQFEFDRRPAISSWRSPGRPAGLPLPVSCSSFQGHL